jgi:hypothetical protein
MPVENIFLRPTFFLHVVKPKPGLSPAYLVNFFKLEKAFGLGFLGRLK